MDPYAQIRAADGRLPTRGVRLSVGSCGEQVLEYDLIPPVELANGARPTNVGEPPIAEVVDAVGGREPDSAAVAEWAKRLGPLFGRSRRELLSSWCAAARVADIALRLRSGDGGMPAMPELSVGHVSIDGGSATVTSLRLSVGGEYRQALRQSPLVRIVGTALSCAWLEGDAIVCATARPETERVGEEALLAASGMPVGLVAESVEGARAATGEEPSDGEALYRLLLTMHLDDARLDPFRGSARAPLAFGSVLSWLWYRTSVTLDDSRVSYCAMCGRPFMVGDGRGLRKKYCGEDCKVAARNDRARKVREAFLRGTGVEECASLCGCSPSTARSYLSGWARLKEELADSIECEGASSELLRRCYDQGLDMGRLLKGKGARSLRAAVSTGVGRP